VLITFVATIGLLGAVASIARSLPGATPEPSPSPSISPSPDVSIYPVPSPTEEALPPPTPTPSESPSPDPKADSSKDSKKDGADEAHSSDEKGSGGSSDGAGCTGLENAIAVHEAKAADKPDNPGQQNSLAHLQENAADHGCDATDIPGDAQD
jgi:hypothetical protein